MSGKIGILNSDAAGACRDGQGGERPYVLGHASDEIDRLIIQAQILRPITERLLRSAGIAAGMRVLDLGCGAGDVSILAAELVGPTGSVIGLDRNPDVLAVAKQRAREAGFDRVNFVEAAVEAFSSVELFDCVIGRYVLVYQADPEGFLRAARRLVRPGGIIALHELSFKAGRRSHPAVSLWDLAMALVEAAFRDAVARPEVGEQMLKVFLNADLPPPNLFCEIPLSGGEGSPFYDWIPGTLRSLQPQLSKMGILPNQILSIDTLKERLRRDVVAARSQISGPTQFCGWVRLPS